MDRPTQTWHAGAEGDDGDGGDLVVNVGDAAKVAGDVADHGRQQADEADAGQEGRPTAPPVCASVLVTGRKKHEKKNRASNTRHSNWQMRQLKVSCTVGLFVVVNYVLC